MPVGIMGIGLTTSSDDTDGTRNWERLGVRHYARPAHTQNLRDITQDLRDITRDLRDITRDKSEYSYISELPSNMILKLKKRVSTNIIEPQLKQDDLILNYTPHISIPEACNAEESHNYCVLGDVETLKSSTTIEDRNCVSKNVDDEDKICCWHCCHSISQVFKLPIRKNSNNIFECIGNFCSPECVLSYIDSDGNSFGDSWNQIELLYNMLDIKERIQPAPRKELLKKFGGKLSIEKFRENSNWNIVIPPCVSLSVQLDVAPNESRTQNSISDNSFYNSLEVISIPFSKYVMFPTNNFPKKLSAPRFCNPHKIRGFLSLLVLLLIVKIIS